MNSVRRRVIEGSLSGPTRVGGARTLSASADRTQEGYPHHDGAYRGRLPVLVMGRALRAGKGTAPSSRKSPSLLPFQGLGLTAVPALARVPPPQVAASRRPRLSDPPQATV